MRKAVIALMLCAVLMLSGCTTGWITQATSIVAALIPAATNIVALVAAMQGKGVSAEDLNRITKAGTEAGKDLQEIRNLIDAYNKADAGMKPTMLNEIGVWATAAQESLTGLLPALHIQDVATQAKITAIVGLVVSEIQSLQAIIPLVSPGASVQAQAQASKQAAKKPPMSAKEFTKAYNATMTAKTGNANLDAATPACKIKSQGWSIGRALGEAKFGGN